MKENSQTVVLLCIIAVTAIGLAYFISLTLSAPREIRYDCSMAEWHPDIPQNVREQCRRQRAK